MLGQSVSILHYKYGKNVLSKTPLRYFVTGYLAYYISKKINNIRY